MSLGKEVESSGMVIVPRRVDASICIMMHLMVTEFEPLPSRRLLV